ncbi:hypothetical protein CDAR_315011 [Caerostris darwini]|uniref:Uncharacterized protein n=1 Tax=Caerostris darwini TaxID=1538125 RepID=A0AAV4TQE2_9ARAC|nr:hypothetical protein CDAR_315011 [Caerostris darwini]
MHPFWELSGRLPEKLLQPPGSKYSQTRSDGNRQILGTPQTLPRTFCDPPEEPRKLPRSLSFGSTRRKFGLCVAEATFL